MGLDMSQLAPSVDAAITLYEVPDATIRAAARRVAAHAHNATDAADILAVLGISMEALMPTNPRISRPMVTISNATSTRRIARCGHCNWDYSNTIKSDVDYQARMHRGMHRAGAIPGTTHAIPR